MTIEVSVPAQSPVTLGANKTLTIAAGATTSTGAVTLTAVDNDVDAPNVMVTVSGAASGGGVTNPQAVTLTITDDEGTPTVTLVLTPSTINESGATNESTVTARLSGKSDSAVTIEVSVPNGSPVTLSANKTLMIAAGATTSTGAVTLTAVDNDVDAPNATVTVSGTASGGGVANPSPVTLTITDDDTAPTTASLSVSPSSVGEEDSATTVTVTATLAGSVTFDADKTVTVTVGKSGDTAISGTDYTGVSGFNITITASQKSGQGTFSLAPRQDTLDEDDEKLTVHATASGLTIADAEVSITDDDALPELTIADASVAEGGKAEFAVTLDAASGRDVTVQWTTGDDDTQGAKQATADTDYTAQSSAATLTIKAGSRSGTIEVQTTEDTLAEGAETFTVTLASPTNATLGTPKTATGTITDDEATPTVTLSLSPATIDESGDDNESTVTATLSVASSDQVTVGVSVPNGSPVTLSANKTLTIAAGATTSTGTVTLTAVDNDVDAPNVAVTVSGAASGGGVSNPSSVTLTISDDEDTPTVTLSLTPSTVDESGDDNESTVTATLSGKSDTAVTVEVSVPNGSPVTLSANRTLTIAAEATTSTGTVTLTAVDNDVDAPNATVTVSGAASGGGVANPSPATLTITDDEATPTANLVLTPSTINESGATNESTVTATLSVASSDQVTVEVSAPGGSPVTLSANKTLTIAAGSKTSTGTVTLTAVDNDVDAPNATVSVSGAASGGGVTNPPPVTLTITDDDTAPTTALLSVSPSSVAEGAAATTVTVTATLAGSATFNADTTVAVTVGKPGDTAISDTDYTGVSGFSITITAGQSSGQGTFTLTPTQDTRAEPDESLTVHATATGLTISDASVSITDDDTASTAAALSVSPSSVAEGAAATTVTVTATLAGSVTFNADTTVAVKVGKAGDTAISGTDYTGVSGFSITITAGQSSGQGTFSLAPRQDTLDEDNEKLTVHATATGLTISDAEVTITDDDTLPELTIADASVAEGGKAEFTVTLDAVSGRDVTVQWTTGDDGAQGANQATAGTDYTAQTTAQTLTIAAGSATGTIEVQTTEDSIVEGAETFTVTLASPTNATLGSSSTATGTITDDDTASTTASLSVSPSSVAEGAAATTVTVTATLAGSATFNADTTVAVKVGKDGDTAISGTDYTGVSGFSITITAGQSSGQGTFSLAPTQDTLDEDDEKLTVHATATGLTIADAEVTITDDDAAPTASVADAIAVMEGDSPEEITDMTFVVSLSNVSGKSVTVSYTLGGTATAGNDYTAPDALSVTIPAGSQQENIVIPILGDTVAEGDETITVTLSSSSPRVRSLLPRQGPQQASGTIQDNDGQPGVPSSLVLSPATISEGGGDMGATFVTARLSEPVTADVTFTVAVAPSTNATASDFRISTNRVLTVKAGALESRGFVTITAVDDDQVGPGKTVEVSATVTGTTQVQEPDPEDLTIGDDDLTGTPDATVTFERATYSLNEDGQLDIGVRLSSALATTAEVRYLLHAPNSVVGMDGDIITRSDGPDGWISTGELTFAAGDTRRLIRILPVDNNIVEPDEEVTISLLVVSGRVRAGSPTVVTLTDDDRSFLYLRPTYAEVEEGEQSLFRLRMQKPHQDDVTVDLAVSGTARAGEDFTALPATLTIPAGGQTADVAIPTVADGIPEGTETLLVSLTNVVGQHVTIDRSAGQHTLLIRDTIKVGPPTAVTLSVSPESVAENAGATTLTLTAAFVGGGTLTTDAAVTVTVGQSGDTGVSGTDYAAAGPVTVPITAGQSSGQATFTLTPTNDALSEDPETLTLHGAATGLSVSDATVTITDDDSTPTAVALSVSPEGVSESAGATTLTLTAAFVGGGTLTTDAAVTVTVGQPGDTAVSGADYTAVGPVTVPITAGQSSGQATFTLEPTDDTLAEGLETLTLHGATTGLTVSDATVTIIDDDPVPTAVALSVSPASVAENAGATTLTLIAALIGTGTFTTDTSVTVTVGASGDTAVAGTDYTAAGTVTVPITAGQGSGQATFTLEPTDDALEEPAETLTLHGAAAGLAVSDATVTIADDDSGGTRVRRRLTVASFGSASYTLNEDGSPVEIAVRLSSAPSEAVELTFTMVSATAEIGRTGDVWSLAGEPGEWRYDQQLIFAPGQTQQYIKLFPVDNNLVEPDEVVTISLSVVSGSVAPGPSTTLTLTDDDLATVLLIPTRSQANEGESAQIRLRLTKPHQQDVTMDCFVRGTATPGVDYASLPHAVMIPAGSQTAVIPVEVLSDETAEGPETLVFVIANPSRSGVVISPEYSEHTVTIMDTAGSSQGGNGQ